MVSHSNAGRANVQGVGNVGGLIGFVFIGTQGRVDCRRPEFAGDFCEVVASFSGIVEQGGVVKAL